ncbi:hypothetical protein C3R44_23380, partial [Mycobacterium tuberculosis]
MRVRLLRASGVPGAARRGLAGPPGALSSGPPPARPGVRRPPLRRAPPPGVRGAGSRPPGRAGPPARRPAGAPGWAARAAPR